jgi:hypothetical protein
VTNDKPKDIKDLVTEVLAGTDPLPEPEPPPYAIKFMPGVTVQIMDLIARNPGIMGEFEELMKALARDPHGEGELAGKIIKICGAIREDGALCTRADDHDGEHDPDGDAFEEQGENDGSTGESTGSLGDAEGEPR